MRKWIPVLLLCSLLLAALSPCALASDALLEISTAEEFLAFAENCRLDRYSSGLQVSLQEDLDLSELPFQGIPLFCGSFYGNGHTISGFSLSPEGETWGFFRYLAPGARVQELRLQGTVCASGAGQQIGGLVGYNQGYLINCSFTGQVSGSDAVGGLVGENAVTGVVESSYADGEVSGAHFVGGLAGKNYGVIRACSNRASVNATAAQNDLSLSDLTLDSLTGTEQATVATDLGGIAGISSGVLRNCENHGTVGYRNMGYNIGGIAGTQSGYITQCRNYGAVSGRKEVGGIVGQLEPAAVLDYDTDTIMILQDQLGTMTDLASHAMGNAYSGADQISGQIGSLRGQAQTARDAVDSLVPDREDPHLPSWDTVLAAQNTLASTMESMPRTLRGIVSSAGATLDTLGEDLQSLSGQLELMGQTVDGAEEHLGASLTDVSDRDSAGDYSGKIESCQNYAPIFADGNVGGIVGAIAVENDLDVSGDWQQVGDASLNFEGQLRAVVLSCSNHASVSGKKQNVGGIAGWQSLGLLRDCLNTGAVESSGTYVGGAAGRSLGYIRSCYVRCTLDGEGYVGGIAGSAAIVTHCYSQVLLPEQGMNRGAVLGERTDPLQEEQEPLAGNFYLAVDGNPGAIDSISYSGLAEPMEESAFLPMARLPEAFQTVTLSFVYPDGRVESLALPVGSSPALEVLPVLPPMEGSLGRWDGLELSAPCYFDRTFHGVYTPCPRVIESEQQDEAGRPLALAEGDFTASGWVQVEPCEVVPVGGDQLLAAWKVSTSPETHTLRLMVEDDGTDVRLLQVEGESTVPISYRREGSYLVFPCGEQELLLVLAAEEGSPLYWIIAAGGAVLLTVCLILLVRKLRKKKKAALKQP